MLLFRLAGPVLRITRLLIILGVLIASVILIAIPEAYFAKNQTFSFSISDQSEIAAHLDKSLSDLLENKAHTDEPITLHVRSIEASTKMSPALKILAALVLSYFCIISVLLINQILVVLENIKNGMSFNAQNLKALKFISLILLLNPLIQYVFHFILSLWVSIQYHIEDLSANVNYEMNWGELMVGVLIYALAIAFEQGLKIQQENELTI